jgi:dienelactone hydrolase
MGGGIESRLKGVGKNTFREITMSTNRFWTVAASAVFVLTLSAASVSAVEPSRTLSKALVAFEPTFSRTEDVIYGWRDKNDLTMDVFTPKGKLNGAGIVVCVSAEFRSGRDLLGMLHPLGTVPLLEAGYVVFAVMHSSQPKYTVPDAIEDIHRAVRFIKTNAKNYGVDPNKLGAAGASSGGHLSLMVGCAGKAGNFNSQDPVDRQSSEVAAVGCFFPPTDFVAMASNCPKELAPAFDFRELDRKSGSFLPVSAERRLRIGQEISPITHVTKESAAMLIIHGDQDKLVPISQAKSMIAKVKDCGAECKLVVKSGKAHGWFGMQNDIPTLVAWFDLHLLGKK